VEAVVASRPILPVVLAVTVVHPVEVEVVVVLQTLPQPAAWEG